MSFFKNRTHLFFLALLTVLAAHLSAGQHNCKKHSRGCYTPMQVSVVSPLQTSPSQCDVNGVRINLIYGKNRHVSGLDLGLINHTTGNMNGCELGIINNVEGNVVGVQRGFFNKSKNLNGCQDGWINICENRAKGMQSGFIFNHARDMTGVQLGGISSAKKMRGLQIGLINWTRDLQGAQIGLLNIQTSRKYVKILPLLNISTSFSKQR